MTAGAAATGVVGVEATESERVIAGTVGYTVAPAKAGVGVGEGPDSIGVSGCTRAAVETSY